MTIYILIFISSLSLYCFAPEVYSLPFCQAEMIVFLLTAFFLLRKTIIQGNYFNFHVFFSISFFFVNFAYPNFIYPLNPEYFWIFTYSFNHDIIPKALSLSQLAFSSYAIGVVGYDRIKKYKNDNSSFSHLLISKKMLRFIKVIFIFVTVVFSVSVISSGFSLAYSDIVEVINDQLVTTYVVILCNLFISK